MSKYEPHTLATMSEETHCFSANLYVDGHKVAEISNHGHGGSDNVRWLNCQIVIKRGLIGEVA